jgi:hydroxymethylpyrimidine/phosphomethylpyrimidine kinase
LQADLRTFTVCGVHGCVAVTAVTVQNSVGVAGFVEVPPSTVADQIRAVATDIGIAAAKTGMLASAAIISAVVEVCDDVGIGRSVPLVVDPVAASMHGDPLLANDALTALRSELLPRATLVTPNLDEVRLLVGVDVGSHAEQHEAARALHALGSRWVLIKGGHLSDGADDELCLDLLYDGTDFTEFTGPRLATPHTHGSGDSLAAAITSALARGAAGDRPRLPARRRNWPSLPVLARPTPVGFRHPPGLLNDRWTRAPAGPWTAPHFRFARQFAARPRCRRLADV